MNILVTGAGGFIGHHLVKKLKAQGHCVRGADIVEPRYEATDADEFQLKDLREFQNCVDVCGDMDHVYHVAADVGGIGYISHDLAQLARNNVLMDSHMLEGARQAGVSSYLYTSSSCAYPQHLQTSLDVPSLKETDVMPADPMPGYGWEKLFAEQMALYYHLDHGLNTHVVRFHNIYGPLGTWNGQRAKGPSSLCRKVAMAPDGGEVEVWGDGRQVRSFCYIDDCVEGLTKIMASDYNLPMNLGKVGMVSVNEMVDTICEVAGKSLTKVHALDKPQGVRGRNPDNTVLLQQTGWEPSIPLKDGMVPTYRWIEEQVRSSQPI